MVPVRAVVLLHHVEARDRAGNPVIRHQTDMFLRTDSVGANLASKVMGSSPARMAGGSVTSSRRQAWLSWVSRRRHRRLPSRR